MALAKGAPVRDPDFLRSVLAARFRRCGGETANTRLFENLPEAVQARLRDAASIGPDELPVLASMTGERGWVLITTKRIVSCEDDKLTSVALESIQAYKMLLPLHLGERAKLEATTIRLTLSSGETCDLVVEPGGKPIIGIVNVILYVVHLNAKRGS